TLNLIERPKSPNEHLAQNLDQMAIERLNTSITKWQSSLNALKQQIQKAQSEKKTASILGPFIKNYFKAGETTINQIKALNIHPDIQSQIIEVYKIENNYLEQVNKDRKSEV